MSDEESANWSTSEDEGSGKGYRKVKDVEWKGLQEKWLKKRAQKLVVPMTAERVRKGKRCGIRMSFEKVSGFRLPGTFQKEKAGNKNKIQYCLHLSLFHTGSQSFFGNTWASEPMGPLKNPFGKKTMKLALESMFVSFNTKIADPACMAVVEVVIVERDPTGSEILGQYGCGWSYLPIFAMINEFSSGGKKQKQDVQMYSGSPRALLFEDGDTSSKNKSFKNKLQPIDGCTLTFSCGFDEQIIAISHLVRENELVGPNQVIHGLKPQKGCSSLLEKENARLRCLPTMDLYINAISALLPTNWEDAVQEYLNLRKGVKLNVDSAGSFIFKVGPHNERRCVSRGGWVEASLKDSDYGGHPQYDRILRLRKTLRIKDIPKDPNIALAFQLEYMVKADGKVSSYIIGCGVWLPFVVSGVEKSKKIILANTHPRSSSTRSPLEIQLLTEMQCPFVDSSLFLPSGNQTSTPPLLGLQLGLKPERIRLARSESEDTDVSESGKGNKKRLTKKHERSSRKSSKGLDSDDTSEDGKESNSGESSFPSSASSKASSKGTDSESSDAISEFDSDGFGWAGNSKKSSRRSKSHSSRRSKRKDTSVRLSSTGTSLFSQKSTNPVDVDSTLLAKTLNLRMHGGAEESKVDNPTSSYTTLQFDPDRSTKAGGKKIGSLSERSQRTNGDVLSSSLTRASRTMLNQNGYVTDTYQIENDRTIQNASAALEMNQQDISIELRDRLKGNEVTIQFAAFRHTLDQVNSSRPETVFFTFQFYNCLPTRTERMRLRSVEETKNKSTSEVNSSGISHPFILTRADDQRYRNAPSLALKFMIDTTTGDDEDPISFAKYLHEGTLFVQVWDGDSLLSLGMLGIPLREIMRQGEKVVKVAKEFDMVQPAEGTNASGVEDIDLFRTTPGRGHINGKVQMILTNFGVKGKGRPTQPGGKGKEKENIGVDWRLQSVYSDSSKPTTPIGGGPSHRVVARPLSETNPELESLIKVASSSSRRILHPSRQSKAAKRRNHGESMPSIESDMVFTSSELTRLDRILDRENRGEVSVQALSAYLNLDQALHSNLSKVWSKLKATASLNVDLYRTFNDLDLENCGTVPIADFIKTLRGILNEEDSGALSEKEAEEIARVFKDSKSRSVLYEKFLHRVLNDDAAELESKLRRVLRRVWVKSGVTLKDSFRDYFDVDGDGMVDKDSLLHGLKELGFQCSNAQIELLLKRYGDGNVLNFSDFCAIAERGRDTAMRGDSKWLSPKGQQKKLSVDEVLRKTVLKAKEKGSQLRDIFRLFDKNKDGHLSMEECKSGLSEIGITVSDHEMKSLFEKLDIDGDGFVHMEEFVAFITRGKPLSATEKVRRIVLSAEKRGLQVRESFQIFDKDGDSTITREELLNGLVSVGVKLAKKEADELFAEMDLDNDGKVNWAEFVAFLMEKRPEHLDIDTIESDIGDKWETRLRKILSRAKREKIDLRECFRSFDEKDAKQVTVKQFRQVLRKLGFDASDEELKPLIEKFDTNGDGMITYDEFLMFAVASPSSPSKSSLGSSGSPRSPKIKTVDELTRHDIHGPSGGLEEKVSTSKVLLRLQKILRQAKSRGMDVDEIFSAFYSTNGSEKVSMTDLEQALDALGFRLASSQDIGDIMSAFDTNGDGMIDRSEFVSFLNMSLPNTSSELALLQQFLNEKSAKLKEKCRRYDKNDDGTVSLSRMMKLVKDAGWEGDVSEEDFEQCRCQNDPDRVEYERLGTDSIKTKLVKAIERAVSKGISVTDLIAFQDRGNVGKMTISGLHKFVIDLGFSILEDKKDTWLGVNDDAAAVSRQLAKVNQLRQHRAIRSDKQGVFDDLIAYTGSSPSEFSNQDAQFNIVKRYREGQKRDLVGSLLRSSLTKEVEIHPSFGKASYFEVLLSNPYGHEERFKIHNVDPELKCITKGEEWRFYRDFVTPAWKGDQKESETFQTPVEDEMITNDTLELTLDANETVSVPFCFMSLASGMCIPKEGGGFLAQPSSIRQRCVPLRVTSARYGHTVLHVNVNIVPKQFVIDRVLHFNGVNNEYLRASIRVRDLPPSEELFVHAIDPSANVQWRAPNVSVKYRTTIEGSGEFFVLLYRDPFHATLFAVWHVCVQPMHRLDFHGVLGQASTNEIIVKGDRFSRRVQCFTSCPGEVELMPHEPFQLVAGAYNKVQVLYRPLGQTPPGTTKRIKIHMVDADSHELVSAWLVKATAALPEVTKTFQLDLPLHQAAHKKIAYVNPWNEPRSFIVRTSDPHFVKAKQPKFEVAQKSKSYIRLWLAAVHKPVIKEVLVFVNDDEDQNEECLLLRLKFSEGGK